MKTALIALFAFMTVAAAPILAQEPADLANSTISNVVVYPNHAQVTRVLTVHSEKDSDGEALFKGLVSTLDPDSLRATGSQGVRIMGTKVKTIYLEESALAELKTLEAKIQETQDKLAALNRNAARWEEERKFYTSLETRVATELGQELGERRISVSDWKEMIDFVRQGLSRCDEETTALAGQTRDLMKSLEVLENERGDYKVRASRERKEVTVAFHAANGGAQKIWIQYIVPSATWEPVYDVHLDRAAGKVQIIGHGLVNQSTGESWDNVNLILAMSRPDFELLLPELQPIQVSLDPQEVQQLAKDVSMLNTAARKEARAWSDQRFKEDQERMRFRRNLEQLAKESNEQLQQYGLSRKVVREALSRVVDRFAGVRYEVEQKETVPCDGSPRKVSVFSSTVPVALSHMATPALGDTVVLKGDIKNTTGHPILEGEVSLFIDNAYIGTSKVESAALNEGVSFCFGPDDTLVVERNLLSRNAAGPEKFRQSQVVTYIYRLSVENFSAIPAQVQIIDQIPISKTPYIQVKFLDTNWEHELDTQSGAIRWAVQMEPGSKKQIDFGFSVECPVDKTIYWK